MDEFIIEDDTEEEFDWYYELDDREIEHRWLEMSHYVYNSSVCWDCELSEFELFEKYG
jgi:hypothetical protein